MSAFFGVPVTGAGGGGGDLADLAQDATAGSVIFSGGGSGLAQDNANFFWDDSNERLGIGTNSPAAHLEVTPDAVKSDETPEEIFQVTERAHTSLSDAEYTAVLFDLSAIVEFDGASDFADQRAIRISAPTYAAEAAHTITRAATLYIDAAPTAGTNVTLTNAYALWVDAGAARFDGVILATDGSQSAPGITFTSDTNTGIYLGSSAEIDITTNGTGRVFISTSVIQFDNINDFNPSGARSITFGADSRWGDAFLAATDIQGGGSGLAITTDPPLLKTSWNGPLTNQTGEVSDVVIEPDPGQSGHEFNAAPITQRVFRIHKAFYRGNGETITNAVSLYIEDAPAVGSGTLAITNAYALWVDAGLARFDGNGTDVFELPADATDPTGGGGAATGRIPVRIGGATVYLAYY